MRGIAFCLLAWSAFDLPTWHIDRAGVALLGLAFAVLAVTVSRAAAQVPSRVRTTTTTADADDLGLSAERLQAIIRSAA